LEANDPRTPTFGVQPQDQFDERSLGAAHVEVRDSERDSVWLGHAHVYIEVA
jgi:hypothetical protein